MMTIHFVIKSGVVRSIVFNPITVNESPPLPTRDIKAIGSIDGDYYANICIHASADLISEKYLFGQDYFIDFFHDATTNSTKPSDNNVNSSNKLLLPIIHVCENCDNQILKKGEMFIAGKTLPIGRIIKSRYCCIMDNSIWNYYLGLNDSHDNICSRFGYVLAEIAKNTCKGIYELYIAREYANLSARMVKESYLIKGGHGTDVVPFVFHSEYNTQEELRREGERKKSVCNEIYTNKWRFLLIDDKATDFEYREESGLKADSSGNKPKIYKKQIITDRLKDIGFTESQIAFVTLPTKEGWGDIRNLEKDPSNIDTTKDEIRKIILKLKKDNLNIYTKVEIWSAASIQDALRAMRCYEFEIILLDYLLDVPEDKKSGVEYGYEIFKRLVDSENNPRLNEFKFGPRGRLYFTFISAFTTAASERLLAENISRSEKHWFIAEGACPTNTPKLFNYQLVKLMIKRISDSGILKLSSRHILKLISDIYSTEDNNNDSVRRRANTYYQDVLSLQYHYRNILKDVEIPFGANTCIFDTNESVLMTDFIQNKINLGGMLEHLTQLVHLTAFGTVRLWPEMWEEYIYFKAQFEKQSREEIESGSIEQEKLKKMFTNIEKYILGLKSQQQ